MQLAFLFPIATALASQRRLGDDIPAAYITIDVNRDHASCAESGKDPTTTVFLPYTPDYRHCFHEPLDGSKQPDPAKPFMSPVAGPIGVNFTYYMDVHCTKPSTAQSLYIPFGVCVPLLNMKIEMTYDLPTPVPGRILWEQWSMQNDCEYGGVSPFYIMQTTRCVSEEHDYEILCGEGSSDAYNTASWRGYTSTDGSCTGRSSKSATAGVDTCGVIAGPAGGVGVKVVWCGGPCRTWGWLARKYPTCVHGRLQPAPPDTTSLEG